MPAKKMNKHEAKTQETRRLLIQAAETIFVRDGYEKAELGEIASLAGRTKGAIYAQFKSKEEIFLTLIDTVRSRQSAEIMTLLASAQTTAENLAAMRNFYLGRVENGNFGLLLLEFKLYTLRHPEVKKTLRKYFANTFTEQSANRYTEILGASDSGENSISRVEAVQVMFPLLSALMLEREVSDSRLSKATVKKIAGRLFEALLPPSPEAGKSPSRRTRKPQKASVSAAGTNSTAGSRKRSSPK